MKLYGTLVVVCAFFGGACGDSSDVDTREVMTGVLAGNVDQLHYATKTQSGMTDANGTFTYRAGETVSFSVGGTTIGRATGAELLTIFDLFGAAPQTDASVILQQLDTQPGSVSPFFRAVNAWTFLLALDVDAKPSNGIDLTGRDAQLTDVHVGFDWWPDDLDAQLTISARVPHYALRPVGLDATFATLYKGIAISGDAIATLTVSFLPDATIGATYDTNAQDLHYTVTNMAALVGIGDVTHDSELRLLGETFANEPDGLGGYGRHDTNSYTFTASGMFTGSASTSQAGASAPVIGRTEMLTYDTAGRLTSYAQADGSVTTKTYAFDAATNTLTVLYESKPSAGDNATYRSRTRTTYDTGGNASALVVANDGDADGVFDSTYSSTSSYDAGGKLISVSSTSTDAAGASTGSATRAYAYDDGRLVSETDANFAADGTTTSTSVTRYTYDGSNLIHIADSVQRGAAVSVQRNDTMTTFDGSGRILTSDEKNFDDGGALLRDHQTLYTYDTRGNVLTKTEQELGSPPYTVTFTYTPTTNAVVARLQHALAQLVPF